MHRISINATDSSQKISRHIYGHFAEHLGRCVYEGLWVGEDSPIPNTRGFRNDVVAALRELQIPNLRWPGGCFADTYHWMDGIGPRERRKGIVNAHWGVENENNHCGTHEFLDLCAQLSSESSTCDPYIAGNMGSGTVKEMAEWLEYLTMAGDSTLADLRRSHGRSEPWQLKFWGVGNENWGCGGHMRAEYYADMYRQYACYCRNFTPDEKLYKVACGENDEWNDTVMRIAGSHMDGLSVHYYTVPGTWKAKGSATDFTEAEWYLTLQKAGNVDDFLKRTSAIMDKYDPAKRVGIVMDEWGTWFDAEPGTNPAYLYQQNTIRDALVAGLSLNIFHGHAERLHVANIAQMVNVLQAMVLTDGPRILLTPTYHVFEMYKAHQDATALSINVDSKPIADGRPLAGTAGAGNDLRDLAPVPQISASASRDKDGVVHVSICNLHHADAASASIDIQGISASRVSGRVLTGPAMNSMNTFEAPDQIRPEEFGDYALSGQCLTVNMPARSIVVLALE